MSENSVVSFDQPAAFWAGKARGAVRRGDFSSALELYYTAMRKEPSEYAYALGAVKALEKLGAFEAEALQITKALNRFPLSVCGELVYSLGCAYAKLGDKKRASDALYTYLSLDKEPPMAPAAKEMLMELDSRLSGETESNKRASALMRQSGRAFYAGDNARMRSRLERALTGAHGEKRAEILSMLAMCHLGGDRNSDAKKCALATLRLKRGDVRASSVLACVYAAEGRFSLSALVMRLAIEGEVRGGADADGNMYPRLKAEDEALFCETCASLRLSEIVRLLYSKRLERNKYDLTALYRLGAAQLNMEMYSEAEDSFYRYLRLAPQDALVSRLLSMAKRRMEIRVPFAGTLPSEVFAEEILPEIIPAFRNEDDLERMLADPDRLADLALMLRDAKFSQGTLRLLEDVGANAEKELLLPLLADENAPMSIKYPAMLRLYSLGAEPPFVCITKQAVTLTQMTKRMGQPSVSPLEAQTFGILLSMLPKRRGRGTLALSEVMNVLRPTAKEHPPLSGATPLMYAEAIMCRRDKKRVPRITPNAMMGLISDQMDEICGKFSGADALPIKED